MIIPKRSSGILLHITSLPSPYGIGDLGTEAYKFADLLAEAGQRYWQILPLNPTELGSGNSPYSSHSAFAGNPLLISPDLLVEDGLLTQKDIKPTTTFNDKKVEFEKVSEYKKQILQKAYENFKAGEGSKLKQEFARFQEEHQAWLLDYTRFVAFKHHFEGQAWTQWSDRIKNREQKGMEDLSSALSEEIEREAFLQFLFFHQWERLKAYCTSKGIGFIGDMPFYVSQDSADVWSHPEIFKLKEDGTPAAVSGVPPDYFSETGQLWGTPVFDWKTLKNRNYDWWIERISHNLHLFDLMRLDHFRAFSAYWEVPAGEETAVNGQWVKSPGSEILSRVKEKYPHMPIIAEDLGDIDQPVRDLIKGFDLPGMLVLVFAFISNEHAFESTFLPHNHHRNSVVYTGTHDNSTARAWYDEATAGDRRFLAEYSGQQITKENVHEVLNRFALMSVSQLAVIPMQDILGLGKEATMNKPSTSNGNWTWRLEPGLFTKAKAQALRKEVQLYGR